MDEECQSRLQGGECYSKLLINLEGRIVSFFPERRYRLVGEVISFINFKEVKGTNRLRDAPLSFFPFARQGKGYSKILEIIKRYVYSFFSREYESAHRRSNWLRISNNKLYSLFEWGIFGIIFEIIRFFSSYRLKLK